MEQEIKEIIITPSKITADKFGSALVKLSDNTELSFLSKPEYKAWVDRNFDAIEKHLTQSLEKRNREEKHGIGIRYRLREELRDRSDQRTSGQAKPTKVQQAVHRAVQDKATYNKDNSRVTH